MQNYNCETPCTHHTDWIIIKNVLYLLQLLFWSIDYKILMLIPDIKSFHLYIHPYTYLKIWTFSYKSQCHYEMPNKT